MRNDSPGELERVSRDFLLAAQKFQPLTGNGWRRASDIEFERAVERHTRLLEKEAVVVQNKPPDSA